MNALGVQAENWPEEVQRQLNEIKETILTGSGQNLTFQLAFLRNNLNQLPQFQSDLAAVQIPPNKVGFLITDFSWLPKPTTSVVRADQGLKFEQAARSTGKNVELVLAISLSDGLALDEVTVRAGSATINGAQEIPFPGKANSKHAVETIDYDYDFLSDLAFAGTVPG